MRAHQETLSFDDVLLEFRNFIDEVSDTAPAMKDVCKRMLVILSAFEGRLAVIEEAVCDAGDAATSLATEAERVETLNSARCSFEITITPPKSRRAKATTT